MNTLTISGPPKSGKSRLALDLASHLAGKGLAVTLVDEGRSLSLGPASLATPDLAIRTRTINSKPAETAVPTEAPPAAAEVPSS